MEKEGLNFSKRRITLSTCGIVKGILELANNGPDIRLALSLTTASEDLRHRLMPLSRENSLPLVKEALLLYQEKRKRRITLEMVLLGGINTGNDDVLAVADFASGLDVVVNLIPWNPVPGLEFEGRPLIPPTVKEISDFAAAMEKAKIKTTRRIKKGSGISGACGQLGNLFKF
jgi:23S rRNA (adenine2503-C2)-methyltransferase